MKQPGRNLAKRCAPDSQQMLGGFGEDCDIAALVPAGSNDLRGLRPWGADRELAERLWAKSEAWTNTGGLVREALRRVTRLTPSAEGTGSGTRKSSVPDGSG